MIVTVVNACWEALHLSSSGPEQFNKAALMVSACGGVQHGEAAVDEDAAAVVGPFEGVAARFGKFRQQWVNKLVVALVGGFIRLSDGYRRNLSAFAATEAAVRCAGGRRPICSPHLLAPFGVGFVKISDWQTSLECSHARRRNCVRSVRGESDALAIATVKLRYVIMWRPP